MVTLGIVTLVPPLLLNGVVSVLNDRTPSPLDALLCLAATFALTNYVRTLVGPLRAIFLSGLIRRMIGSTSVR